MLFTETAEGGAGVLRRLRRRARRARPGRPDGAGDRPLRPRHRRRPRPRPGRAGALRAGLLRLPALLRATSTTTRCIDRHTVRDLLLRLAARHDASGRRRPRPRRRQRDWLNALRDSGLETPVRRLARRAAAYRLPDDAPGHRRRGAAPARTSSTDLPAARSRSSSTARTTTTPPAGRARRRTPRSGSIDLGWIVIRFRHDEDWAGPIAAAPVGLRRRQDDRVTIRHADVRRRHPGPRPRPRVGGAARQRRQTSCVLRPLGGGDDDVAGVFPAIEDVEPATLPAADRRRPRRRRAAPTCCAPRCGSGSASSAGPFRSPGRHRGRAPRLPARPAAAWRCGRTPVRLLIADDVGIGKTIEAGLIAAELLAQGDAQRLAVLCSPALAEQWQRELREKFGIDAELVLPSHRQAASNAACMLDESLFERLPVRRRLHRLHQVRPAPRTSSCAPAPSWSSSTRRTPASPDAGGGQRARHQRYELLRGLAADPHRHLILVTATPHRGNEEAFRNLLGLLDPDAGHRRPRRSRQRPGAARPALRAAPPRRHPPLPRRGHPVPARPADHASVPTALTRDYRAPVRRRPRLRPRDGPRRRRTAASRQRVRWWSALALLRALASIPARRRRDAAHPRRDADAADRRGGRRARPRRACSTSPTTRPSRAPTPPPAPTPTPSRRPDAASGAGCWRCAREADALDAARARTASSPRVTKEVKALLADGYDPIVFCRFIDTAEYVAEHLAQRARQRTSTVAAVTGALPPAEREHRIAELTGQPRRARPGRHRLPVRGRQPAGRLPGRRPLRPGLEPHPPRAARGPRRPVRPARATSSGPSPSTASDNRHRRHRPRRAAPQAPGDPQGDRRLRPRPRPTATASSRPLLEGLLLRGQRPPSSSPSTWDSTERTRRPATRTGTVAAEQEKRSRTKYAQQRHQARRGRRPRSPTSARALGSPRRGRASSSGPALRRARRAPSRPRTTASPATHAPLPLGAPRRPAARARRPAAASTADLPGRRGGTPCSPAPTRPSQALARYVLDTALDPAVDRPGPARPPVPASSAPRP